MVITKQKDLDELCKRLNGVPFITIDTEFLREKTYFPKLCLIQVSDPDGKAAAIDPLSDKISLEPLFKILSDQKILKVFHAGRQDLEIFYNLTGQIVSPIFDTQIAAMVCGYGESVGYNNIVREITGVYIDKAVQFTDWSRRPLSQKQIDYALGDVIHLVGVYKTLHKELEKQGRTQWVFEEEEILLDPETYKNTPEDAWKRVKIKSPKPKNLAILKELAAWREIRAQEKDLPRAWVLKDDVMAAIALQIPQNITQLSKTRNIPKGLVESSSGEKIIELINTALKSNPDTWPAPERRKTLSPSVKASIEILKMLLRIQANEHGVAPKLIADQGDIEALALGSNDNLSVLKGWRYDVFGKDALALKSGKLMIGLKNGQIVKSEIK